MRINYNVTGQARKALIGAISQELNAPAKYLGAPTFAYEVGGYHIDKNGVVTGSDNLDLEADLQGLHGFEAAERDYDEPDTYESGLGGLSATPSIEEVNDEAEVWAEREMRRLKLDSENIPDYSNRGQYGGDYTPAFEDLEMDGREELGLGRTHRENWHGENGMQASDVPEPDEPDQLVIEMPLTGFTPEKLDNLTKLVTAKAPLLKAALGVDELPIQQTDEDGGKLRFPWFTVSDKCTSNSGDTVKAYTTLIQKLCEAVKEKRHVTAKEREVDNPKYAMRCWLLSLGFIGDEYKASRKVLLSRLDGNCSFKSGNRPSYTTCCYTYPNGIEGEAMDCTTVEFTSLAKAKAHCDTFAANCSGIHFAGAHVEDSSGNYVYELPVD